MTVKNTKDIKELKELMDTLSFELQHMNRHIEYVNDHNKQMGSEIKDIVGEISGIKQYTHVTHNDIKEVMLKDVMVSYLNSRERYKNLLSYTKFISLCGVLILTGLGIVYLITGGC